MSRSKAAQRYAESLYEVARAHGEIASVEQDLREVKEVLNTNPDFFDMFASPQMGVKDKQALVRQLFAGANEYVLNTLLLAVERKRINEVKDIVDEFIHLSYEDRGIAEATVYSTRFLTETEAAAISETFARKVGKQALRIENVVDPSLIGGLRVQIGNRIFDSSVSSKLESLQRQLSGRSTKL
ncbi:F0F1 ATP synthase subunit delta [Planococcus lenghuensis]|uniref:ATP synthase subunit delta n=1 Tax=Planococcus lenghuensis TaxID=2213202 RepID=A0A1Q2L1I0_9BACL|nr:F0F1 ATP synthase subunit delta [Planococcus lenghuensis]AQQ54273.1 F0F1 ATP synthase subunit delta [Planococcus lenghuensis]